MPLGTDTVIGRLVREELRSAVHAGIHFVQRDESSQWFHWTVLADRASRAAGALAAKGVRRDDRVAIVLPTGPEFFDVWLGAQWLGAVPVALYPPVRLGRLEEYFERTTAMLRAVNACMIVTERRIAQMIGRIVAEAKPRLGVIDASGLVNGPSRDPESVYADDLAMIQFSSGTTSDPKPVALTNAQVLANADAITAEIFRAGPYSVEQPPAGVSWLPLYHDMGLIGCVLPSISAPGTLVLIPPEVFLARPAIWLRTISRFKATISPAPNFAYDLCVDRVRDEDLVGVNLQNWRMALNGAEPVAPSSLRRFAERFLPFGFRDDALMPVYGLSEAALAVTFSRSGQRAKILRVDSDALGLGRLVVTQTESSRELVSVGPPIIGFGVEIRGPGGEGLEAGRVGRVFVAGPSLMRGYLDRDSTPILDGWLDTGDLGALWEGELYITGRAKDVIIVRGRNHAPQDLERALDSVNGVRIGCTAAVASHEAEGERVLMFVEVRELRDGMAEACSAAVRAATGVDPSLVVLLEPGTLPRTSSGKIRRAETLRLWHQRALVPPEKVGAWMLAGAFAGSALAYLRHTVSGLAEPRR